MQRGQRIALVLLRTCAARSLQEYVLRVAGDDVVCAAFAIRRRCKAVAAALSASVQAYEVRCHGRRFVRGLCLTRCCTTLLLGLERTRSDNCGRRAGKPVRPPATSHVLGHQVCAARRYRCHGGVGIWQPWLRRRSPCCIWRGVVRRQSRVAPIRAAPDAQLANPVRPDALAGCHALTLTWLSFARLAARGDLAC